MEWFIRHQRLAWSIWALVVTALFVAAWRAPLVAGLALLAGLFAAARQPSS